MRVTILLILAILSARSASAANLRLNADDLRFVYQSEDQTAIRADLPCAHALLNADSQDWTVKCGEHSYTVHLWLTAYEHTTGPSRISYELLYWITDNTDPRQPRPSGTTVWFHLKNRSDLTEVEASESVEDDAARLKVEIRLNALRTPNLMPSGHGSGRRPQPAPAP